MRRHVVLDVLLGVAQRYEMLLEERMHLKNGVCS